MNGLNWATKERLLRSLVVCFSVFFLGGCGSVHFVVNEGTYVAAKLPSYSKKGSQDGGAFSYLYGPQAGIFFSGKERSVPVVEGMFNFSAGVQENDGGNTGGGGTVCAGYSLCFFQVMCPSACYMYGGAGNSGMAFMMTINSDKFVGGLTPEAGGVAAKEIKAQEQREAEEKAIQEDLKTKDEIIQKKELQKYHYEPSDQKYLH